ncbi:MAG TPA: thioredoxin domain-containing protein [Gemmatimonadales bacterium]|nr:thioredoxin domain-containing protein [Gemmatimonadales bacterium]
MPTSWTALLALTLLGGGAATYAWTAREPAPETPTAASPAPDRQGPDPDLLRARTKGDSTAPVTVVEMSDFQCPFCRRFATESFPALDSEYVRTGKVRWIFLNFPLTQIHPNAAAAAEMAMCSAEQGRFWPVHDLLYKHQALWAPLRDPGQFLLTLADSVGMSRDSLLPCLQEGRMRAQVERDANTSARIGANSTPTFLIGGALLSGAYPTDLYRHILDSIYTEKTSGRR